MLATRHTLRLRRPQLPTLTPALLLPRRSLATTRPRPQQKSSTTRDGDSACEDYVRSVRTQWGSSLPENLLTDRELALYERHYGKPVRMLRAGEGAEVGESDGDSQGLEAGTMTLQGADGEDIEVEEEGEEGETELEYVPVPVSNEADGRSFLQLKADMERAFRHRHHDTDLAAYSTGEEDVPPGAGDGHIERTHPLTSIGRFATHPFTVRVPPSVQQQTLESLSAVPNKHLDAAAVRVFGSRQLPDSPVFTNSGGKTLTRPLLDAEDARMSDIEAELWLATVLPGYYSQSLSALTELRRRLGGDWALGGVRSVLDVGSGGAAVLAWRSVVEAEQGLRRDEAVARAGAEEGRAGAEEGTVSPPPEADFSGIRATVVTAAETLRYRMAKQLSDTTFIPRMPDRNPDNVFHSPSFAPGATLEPNQRQRRKTYDLIIATHNMLPLRETHHRRDRIKKLWSHLTPSGGVLLLIEKGTPLGFEAIAGARATLLRNYISSPESTHRAVGGNSGGQSDLDTVEKEPGAIIAPCTNHAACPLFPHGHTDGVGRKDWCHFVQRYERPSYLQRIMGANARNHDDLLYSFVAVRRGVDYRRAGNPVIEPDPDEFHHPEAAAAGWAAPTQSPYSMDQLRRYAFTLPRTLFPPIKRHGHVTLDVCTPTGTLERWTVPKSYSRTAFRDARKSRWGDLWALGSKSKTLRNVRVGGAGRAPVGTIAKLIRVPDGEGGVEERVSWKRVHGAVKHWSRGNRVLGERVRARRKARTEMRWRAREEEMGVEGY